MSNLIKNAMVNFSEEIDKDKNSISSIEQTPNGGYNINLNNICGFNNISIYANSFLNEKNINIISLSLMISDVNYMDEEACKNIEKARPNYENECILVLLEYEIKPEQFSEIFIFNLLKNIYNELTDYLSKNSISLEHSSMDILFQHAEKIEQKIDNSVELLLK